MLQGVFFVVHERLVISRCFSLLLKFGIVLIFRKMNFDTPVRGEIKVNRGGFQIYLYEYELLGINFSF